MEVVVADRRLVPHIARIARFPRTSPGQVGFTPDGGKLVVTTKASGSNIVVYRVQGNGRLSSPVVNASATPVPFAFTFGPGHRQSPN